MLGDTLSHRLTLEITMDFVYLAAVGLLWLVMVLLVAGFRKLERPQGVRP